MNVQKLYIPPKDAATVMRFLGNDQWFSTDLTWNTLMPLVDKIETLESEDGRGQVPYVVTIEPQYCVISRGGEAVLWETQSEPDEPKIQTVWETVLKFIEAYNNKDI